MIDGTRKDRTPPQGPETFSHSWRAKDRALASQRAIS
jgi:hypothetical protein